MKIPPVFTVLLSTLVPVSAQEGGTPKWDVELPAPVPRTQPAEAPEPQEPIGFQILSSRTTRVARNDAPPMSGLPPVSGTINLTVQMVEDPGLPDPPPPLPVLPPSDPAVAARLLELRAALPGRDIAYVSATVVDGRRTLLRIHPGGGREGEITAWSNLDFHHFSGVFSYHVHEPGGPGIERILLLGLGNLDSARLRRHHPASEIPDLSLLPDVETSGPAFLLVEGDPQSPAIRTLEQLHHLYRKEGLHLKASHLAAKQAEAAKRTALLAAPPQPEDVVIQFWERGAGVPPASSTTTPAAQAGKEAGQ